MFWYFIVFVVIVVVWLKHIINNLSISNYDKKPVLITGCDTGFGNGLALELLANGIPVYAGCLTKEGEEALRYSARFLPGKLMTLPINVTDQTSVDAAVELVERDLGVQGLWAIVNNAGVAGSPSFDDWLSISDYQKTLDVNSLGVIRITHAFSRFVKRTRGRIVTVCSVMGRIPLPMAAPYTVSKHATEAYCDVLRHEMRPFGVTVHILEPGFFATNILNAQSIQKSVTDKWNKLPSETKTEYGTKFFDQIIKIIPSMTIDVASTAVNLVTMAYYHAITARFPKSRYWVGYDAKLFFIPLSVLPTAIQDIFLYNIARKIFKFPTPKLET